MSRQAKMTVGTDAAAAASAPKARARSGAVRSRPNKRQQLIRLLSAKAGADTGTIGRRLGWQKHTVRAALSGLRKAGYRIEGERPGEGRAVRYRILAAAASGTVAGNAGENA